uniref:MIT domain-containing protein n=1 Tax=Globisporangium ultimum (strain ATCC 200006 / CBS 805.95 / DAOM BR144) TaxID=431595 RepID=K3W8B8_GLOUD
MAARLDLEARLRALRAPKATTTSSSSSTASSPAPHLPTPPNSPPSRAAASPSVQTPLVDDAHAWPEVPHAWPEVPRAAPTRRNSSLYVALEVTVIPRRASSVSSNSSQHRQPLEILPAPMVAAPAPAPMVPISSLLGPAYDEAVHLAQFAIDSERSRNVHTAIDAYIRAGQMLISIGRQQHTAHLQNIVKKKALALLERAEGLSDWVTSVTAVDNSEAAIDAAFAESQRENEQSLTEKEALVAQMKSENTKMSEKLNQLVLLTKVRARFRRVLSDRRARKEAEKAMHNATLNDAKDNNGGDLETATEEEDEEHERQRLRSRSSSTSSTASSSFSSSGGFPRPSPEVREEQKRDLINELHTRIGLPEINQLRKFKPLSTDATKDIRHVELEDELEAARLEAERLRVAVQEMEEAFQSTLEQTRQQSLKLKQEKDENLAKMEDELQRVRSELEHERRLTAKSFGSSSRSMYVMDDNEDEDPDSYEDVDMIRTLRSSLHAMDAPRSSASSKGLGKDSSASRTNHDNQGPEADSSLRKYKWSTSESSEDDSDVDEDGGVWL